PSSSALVATVVPCANSWMSAGSTPCRSTASSAFITACEGSAGTEATLAKRVSPVSGATATRSVKVPPASTPTIQAAMALLHRLLKHARPAELLLQCRQRQVRDRGEEQHQDDAEVDLAGVEQRAVVG